MNTRSLFVAAAAMSALQAAQAQDRTIRVGTPTIARSWSSSDADHRAVLGVTTGMSGTLRDTLGIMITALTRGGPAEKAGLEEGNRIQSINGVNLRANAADVEDNEMSNALARRLTRELAKAKAGDEVELRVYRDGKTQTMKLKTGDAEDVFRSTTGTIVRTTKEDRDNRPALGLSLGSSGSRRDTLGVLVMAVADSTPAAKAGIEEGNRIASINGVNLRVSREDAGDRYMSNIKSQRFQREISQLKVGDNVTLSVYSNGKVRDVSMKVARAGDLPRSAQGGYTIFGGDGYAPFPAMPVMPAMPSLPAMPAFPSTPGGSYRVRLNPELNFELDRALESSARARVELRALEPQLRTRLESVRPQLENLRFQLEGIRPQVRMQLENARPMIERIAPMVRIRTTTTTN